LETFYYTSSDFTLSYEAEQVTRQQVLGGKVGLGRESKERSRWDVDGKEKSRTEGTKHFENIPHIADFHLVTGENSQESCFEAYHRALNNAKALAHSSSLQIKWNEFYSNKV